MTAATIRTVALDKLTPDPANVRKNFDKQGIATLAANLKARGVLTPLLVREDKKNLVIVDGERRWRAAKVAKLKTVPIVVLEAGDAVQRSLDQVAVNSLREPLKPLELGRLLVSLRKEHKLSDNQIAAHLDKQGIPALSKGQMAELMRLVDLPDWAQEMVDEGQLEASAAPTILEAARDPKVIKDLRGTLVRDAKVGGKLPTAEVVETAAWAYHRHGEADLTKTDQWHQDPVRFNPAVACKGCEHLRIIGRSTKVCMNRKHFDELQAQAKEAGLLPGGKKPSAQKKGAETRAENEASEQRAERKVFLYAEKLQHLVHARLQQHIITAGLLAQSHLVAKLPLWLAAGKPEGRRYGRQWYGGDARSRSVEDLVEGQRLKSLTGFLQAELTELNAFEEQLAIAAVRVMSWQQTQALAHHLQVDIQKAFTVDEDYLAIQSLDQLKELGRLAGIEGANTMTGKALKADILGAPDRIATLGVPADVVRLYSDVPEADPEEDEDEDEGGYEGEDMDEDDANLDEHQEVLDEAGEIDEEAA